jgi:hypothetical protein
MGVVGLSGWGEGVGVRLRLSDPSRLPEFIGFLAVPAVTVHGLDDNDIEVEPSGGRDGDKVEVIVELMLRAWNSEHGEGDAVVVGPGE